MIDSFDTKVLHVQNLATQRLTNSYLRYFCLSMRCDTYRIAEKSGVRSYRITTPLTGVLHVLIYSSFDWWVKKGQKVVEPIISFDIFWPILIWRKRNHKMSFIVYLAILSIPLKVEMNITFFRKSATYRRWWQIGSFGNRS